MKLLLVNGDDYSALQFESSIYTVEEIIGLIEDKNEERLEEIKNELGYTDFQLFEFGEVDPKFIRFVRDNIQDYDTSKSENFYIIGEEFECDNYEDYDDEDEE